MEEHAMKHTIYPAHNWNRTLKSESYADLSQALEVLLFIRARTILYPINNECDGLVDLALQVFKKGSGL